MRHRQEEKDALRNRMRKLRASLSPSDIRALSGAVLEKVLVSPEYQAAETLFSYVSLPREVQTDALICAALSAGKRVAVPKTETITVKDGRRESVLRFYEIRSLRELSEGTFHVREPKGGLPVTDNRALVILPGLSFDRTGNRLGYGKSYYDRFLREEAGHPTMALCFHFALLDKIPSDPWDVRADVILTDREIVRVHKDAGQTRVPDF